MGRYLERVRSLEQVLTQPGKDASVASAHGLSRPLGGYDINDIHDKKPLGMATQARSLEAQDRLLARLRAGVEWLTAAHNGLCAFEGQDDFTSERYVKLRDRFLASLDRWDALEYQLRFVYQYQGCVLGQGQVCPGDAPVRCRSCAGMTVSETGEQRYA